MCILQRLQLQIQCPKWPIKSHCEKSRDTGIWRLNKRNCSDQKRGITLELDDSCCKRINVLKAWDLRSRPTYLEAEQVHQMHFPNAYRIQRSTFGRINTTAARARLCGASAFPSWRNRAANAIAGRRYKITATGENKTGHIQAGPNEGILFLDNVFPLRLSAIFGLYAERLLPRVMQHLRNPNIVAASPERLAERAIPSTIPISIESIIPRVEEGGAFVKFRHDQNLDVREVEQEVKQFLRDNPIKPWFNPLRRIKTSLVQGRPWVEDLHRLPSPKVKVEFEPMYPGRPAEELSQETLYSLFRTYGKLADIVPQHTETKDGQPKHAYLKYTRVRHAIRAKNCMHGFKYPDGEQGHGTTILKLSYVQKRKAYDMWNWLVNHPRLVIPILLAVFGTVTVSVFDPYVMIGTWNISSANEIQDPYIFHQEPRHTYLPYQRQQNIQVVELSGFSSYRYHEYETQAERGCRFESYMGRSQG